MICETCAETADLNRRIFNAGVYSSYGKASYPHPKNCGCACQHRKPTQWDKYFSVKESGEEDSESSE